MRNDVISILEIITLLIEQSSLSKNKLKEILSNSSHKNLACHFSNHYLEINVPYIFMINRKYSTGSNLFNYKIKNYENVALKYRPQ